MRFQTQIWHVAGYLIWIFEILHLAGHLIWDLADLIKIYLRLIYDFTSGHHFQTQPFLGYLTKNINNFISNKSDHLINKSDQLI